MGQETLNPPDDAKREPILDALVALIRWIDRASLRLSALESIVKAKTGVTEEEWQNFVREAQKRVRLPHELEDLEGIESGLPSITQFLERAIKRQ